MMSNGRPITNDVIFSWGKECVERFNHHDSEQRQKDLVTLMKCYREGNNRNFPLDCFHLLTATIHVSFLFYQKNDGTYAYLNPKEVIKVGRQKWRVLIHVNTSSLLYGYLTKEEAIDRMNKAIIHELVHVYQYLNQDHYETDKDYLQRFCEREAETVALFYCKEIQQKNTAEG